MKLALTEHFIDRWRQRICKPVPPPSFIRHLLRHPHTLRLQKGRRLVTPEGSECNTLTIYYYTPAGLLLFIDHFNRTAVTVMTTVGRN